MRTFFRHAFGDLDDFVVADLVKGSPDVDIHIAKSSNCKTFFTVGMSLKPMNVPVGLEAYRLAELYIQLADTWPTDRRIIDNEDWNWPVQWLKNVAAFPTDKVPALVART
ncbi:Ankyrin [Rhodopirellula maiorica SM1]|uniref:Ankyrin n=1 Tax=Rhodopirellula maiorica SM1 TaxID=1265738 RepID=M5RFU3_9BACT|nr:Ankyrin [Rhodopirellula maiorica SM1]